MAVSESGAPVIDPMYQFEVKPLFGGGKVDGFLTITNSTLWMAIAIVAISALLIMGMRGRALTGTQSYAQNAELAERGRSRAEHFFPLLDELIGEQ